ncbi:MAG: YbjQ family protein [Anaerovoracaceae bacterium]|nr:YbjQ family protein [Anaerovoracaceae bacterium]
MELTTLNYLPGKEIENLGVVKGNVVTTKNIGKDIGAGLKSMIGGELVSYTKMLTEAREIATERMVAEAESLGADAVLLVRYSTSAIMQSAAEIIAYGTAVKFK